MSIILYDFNDSFSLNIYSEIYEHNQNIQVIKYADALKSMEALINKKEKSLVILGPGPGHPRDYEQIVASLIKLQKCDQIFFLGVCLGHQLIAHSHHLEVTHAKVAVHGQVMQYKIEQKIAQDLALNSEFKAQRYNSLYIPSTQENRDLLNKLEFKACEQDDEFFLLYGERLLTYQFHPESIGTNYRKSFFKKGLDFLL